MSTIPRKHRSWNWGKTVTVFSAIALLSGTGAAFAAVPTVVVNAQETVATGLSTPQSLVVAPNNTYYVADQGNNQVLAYANGASSKVNTGSFVLNQPTGLAVDSSGDLFISDNPTSDTSRIIEALATNGVLNGTVNQVIPATAGLISVYTLAEDSSNNLYIGDGGGNAIYTVAPGTTTLTKLALTGLPSDVQPSALAIDKGGNLFVGDFLSTVYEVPVGSTTATAVNIPGFTIYSPNGIAFDPNDDLYILALQSGGAGVAPVEYVTEVPYSVWEGAPGGAWDGAYLIPYTDIGASSSLAFNSNGTMYVLDWENGNVVGLIYSAAVNMGEATVGKAGSPITFNYEINAPIQSGGFNVSSKGDVGYTEMENNYATCELLNYTDGNNGGPITPSNPYTCIQVWSATPAYPGIRSAALVFNGPSNVIYSATPVFFTGLAGASTVYPLTVSTGARNIVSPRGLAVSGLDRSLYISSEGGLYRANGPNGTTLTAISTAPVGIGIPSKIVLNGNGDLYLADFGNANDGIPGRIVVVPRSPSQTPYVLNTGTILQHPFSIAFDTYGNLFVGDTGPAGSGADSSNPGFIAEIPVAGGAPFKVNTGSTTIIYPIALAVDPYTNDIYVGDGGNPDETDAEVVKIPAGGGTATVVTPPNVTQAAEIVFDPAEEFFVLDQNSNEITGVRPDGTSFVLPFNNSSIGFLPWTLAITNGGESFVEGSYGTGTGSNLVYLNGKSSPLAFGSVVREQTSDLTATVNNVGSASLRLSNPYYTSSGSLTPFSILGSSTCHALLTLAPASTCDIDTQFHPTSTGSFSKTFTLRTNGYITNDSVVDLTGTGTR